MNCITIRSVKFITSLFLLLCCCKQVKSQAATGLNFDGINDYVSVPDPLLGTSDLTLEAYVKSTSFLTPIISTRTSESTNAGKWFTVSTTADGRLTWELADNNSSYTVFTGTTLMALNAWYHIAIVRQGTAIRFYINGSADGNFTDPVIRDLTTGNNAFRLGAMVERNAWYKGDMDEIRTWKRALCQAELQNNNSCELALPQSDLYEYYKLNQGTVNANNTAITTATDNSGNGRNATLVNFGLTGATSNWSTGIASGTCATFVTATPASQTSCSGSAITNIILSNATSWTRDNTATVTGIAASGTGNISGTLTNTTSSPVTVTFTITATCSGLPITATVTVNPLPTVNAVSNQVVCNNGSTTAVNFSSNLPGGIICATANEGSNAVLTAPAGTVITAITFASFGTPNGSCGNFSIGTCHAANSISVVSGLAVGQNTVSIPVSNATFGGDPCNGTAKRLYIQATYSPVYTWVNNTPSIGLAANGTGNIPAFNAANTGTAPVTATITVTQSFTNAGTTCTGAATTFTITVNPTAAVNQPVNQVVCNNGSTTAVNFSSNLPGGIICATANEGSNAVLTAPAGTVITAITFASYGTPNGSCGNFTTGACNATNSVFVVSALALGQNTVTIPASNTTFSGDPCNGTAKRLYIQATYSPVFNWTNDNTSIGLAASGTGNIASFNAVNTGTAPVTATITVTQTFTNAGVTCNGTAKTFTITVNPTATVNAIANQTVCSNTTLTGISFSSPTTGGSIVYSWANSNTSIGLAASGTGNIASFNAVNTGTTPITATITVTPTYTNGGSTCNGTARTFTITVNRNPTVNPIGQRICNGDSVHVIFNGVVAGTVYNWTNNNTAIGLAASGTGNIPAFVSTNATNMPLHARIITIPSYTNAGATCIGKADTSYISVKPAAVVDMANQGACNNNITAVNFTGITVPGTTYTWTNSNTSIGLAASGTGNLNFTATNTTNAPVTATITVSPHATVPYGRDTLVYIPNAGSNNVSVINMATNAVFDSIPVGTLPRGITVTNNGGFYVSNSGSNSVSTSGGIQIPVGSSPIGLCAHPTANRVYVANSSSNTVSVINSGVVVATIPVGQYPLGVCVSPDGNRVYVTNYGTNTTSDKTVSVINANTNTVVATITVGNKPTGVCISPDGSRLYVASWLDETISIINTADNTVIGTVDLDGTQNYRQDPYGICVSPDGSWLYVADNYRNEVITMNTADNALGYLSLDPGNTTVSTAYGISVTPGGSRLYVSSVDGNKVYAVNTATNTVVATVGVGSAPFAFGNFIGVDTTAACQPLSKTFTITVNPTATVNTIANQTVCNGAATTAITFSSPATGGNIVYNWTNNNTSIGLAASGTGNITSFTATNTSSAPVTATITIIPAYTNAGTTCNGTARTFTITVNPAAVVNTIDDQVVCNGTSTTAISFSSPTTGGSIVYNWTNNNTSIGLAASGTGDITSFTAANTTNAPIIATITVTLTYTNAGSTCNGTARTFTITVNPTATVNTIANQTVCNGRSATAISFSSPTTGGSIVYNWTNSNPSIGLATSGTSSIAAFTATNTGTAPVTAIITVTPSYTNGNITCIGTAKSFTITVNPTATVNTIANKVVCGGTSTTAISFNSPTTGGSIVYNWTNNNTSIGLAANGTGNIPVFTAANTTNAPITATITVTPAYTNGDSTCTGTVATFTITVNPIPAVLAVANQVVCNNSLTNAVNFSGNMSGTICATVNQGSNAVLTAPSGTVISAITFASYGNPNGSCGNFSVGSCHADTSVSVVSGLALGQNTVSIPATNAVFGGDPCNGTGKRLYIQATYSSVPVIYNWTNNNPSIGLVASDTGNIAAFTATNVTGSPVTATITVTPAYTNAGITCNGTPQTFTIIVNPVSTINAVANQTVCNGTSTTAISFSSPATGGSIVYNWTNNKTSIGLAATGTGNIAAFTATNTGTAPVTATITVTAVYTNNGITCTDTARTFTITVNPVPTVNAVANQVLCNGTSTTAVNFSGGFAGTAYNWTNNNTSIGLAASGTGNIAAFTATNTGAFPITATITVMPSFTNAGITCTGTSKTFTITVNPSGTMNAVGNYSACSGNFIPMIGFSSSAAGAVYNWTNNNTSIGLAASGTGNIPAFAASNTSNAPVTATITVSACSTPTTFTITVNPIPGVNTVNNQNICNGDLTNAVIFSGPVSGTVYNWTNNNTAIGLAASGTGNIPAFTAVNTGATTVSALIAVIPTYTNDGITCEGSPISFEIAVKPTPTLNAVADQVVCNNSLTDAIIFSGNQSSGTICATANQGSTAVLTAPTGTVISVITFASYGNPNGSCGNFATGTCHAANSVSVVSGLALGRRSVGIPATNATFGGDPCSGTAKRLYIQATYSPVYNWTNNNPSIGLAASGTGNIAAFTATNASSSPASANITVTPVYNDGVSAACTGASRTFTITVNPTPTAVASPASQNIISTNAIIPIVLNGSNVSGTVYNWTRDNMATATGIAASGSGDISGSLTNTTTSPVTVTFTITPTYTNAGTTCTGTPITAVVTIDALNVWTGGGTTDMNLSNNWSLNTTPSATLNAIVPAGNTPYPISTADITVKNLSIGTGATVTIGDGKTLTVNAAVTGAGNIGGSSTSNLVIAGAAGTLNFTSGASLNNLTLTASANATLGTALNVYGTIALNTATLNLNGQNLVLKSNAAGTARIANLTGSTLSGATNVTMERFIKLRTPGTGPGAANYGRAYRLICPTVNTATSIRFNWMNNEMNTAVGSNVNIAAPNYGTQISGPGGNANGFDVTQTNQSSLYNTANAIVPTYTAITNTSGNLNALTGYFLYLRGDRSVSMQVPLGPNMPTTSTTLRATGTVVTGPVSSFTNAFTGGGTLNLVTNPYPSPIDWQAVRAASTGITDYYTYWDPNYGTRGGFVTVSSAETGPLRYIQSGQAFFVESNGVGTPVVNMLESHKAAGNNNDVFLVPPPPAEAFAVQLYFTEPSGYRRLSDEADAWYGSNYSAAVDEADAREINNWDENISIAREGKHLAIEQRPVIVLRDTLPLFMNNMKQQGYEFEFRPQAFTNPALTAELIDHFLGVRRPLSVTDPTIVSFQVTADAASSASDRFMVVFGPGRPLAIDAISITARAKNQGVQVDWQAKTETDMDKYEVEKSTDGANFSKQNTTAAIGNSTVPVNYGWFDATPVKGNNFYRVKAFDKIGTIKYTSIVKVNIGSAQPSISVVPNPVTTSNFGLLLTDLDKGVYTLILYNSIGQQVYSSKLQHDGGTVLKQIQPGIALANGNYRLLLLGDNNTRFTVSIIKN